MKFKASNVNIPEVEVEINGIPTLTYEELKVPTHDGNIAFVAGNHSWNRLETTSDMSAFFGQWFGMTNDEWSLHDCIILEDKKSIYFRNANQISR